jgi:hypothetical protein
MRRQPTDSGQTGPHGRDGVYYVTHEPATPGGLTATLTHAIATVVDVDVTVAELAVGDRVDPAALDRLFSPSRRRRSPGQSSLGFDIWGHGVTVRSDGRIEIRPPHALSQGAGAVGSGGRQPP